MILRADLHDTILSHATSSRQAYDMTLRLSQRFKTCFKMLRHFCRRTQQSYIMSWACRKLLSHATKSYRVNRPLGFSFGHQRLVVDERDM